MLMTIPEINSLEDVFLDVGTNSTKLLRPRKLQDAWRQLDELLTRERHAKHFRQLVVLLGTHQDDWDTAEQIGGLACMFKEKMPLLASRGRLMARKQREGDMTKAVVPRHSL